MHFQSTTLRVAILATLTSVAGLANAGGFGLSEHGVSGLGNAYAGAAAVAADTSTVWNNPAGMLQLADREVSFGLHVLAVDNEIIDQGTTLNTALGGGLITGPESASDDGITVIPNIYYVAPVTKNFVYGFAIDVPFGSGSDYGTDWRGRYSATESTLAIIDFNPTIAYRVSNSFHIGGGVSLQYADATLANAVDSGAVCLALSPDPAVCVNAGLTPGNAEVDSQAEITGDSVAFGFNLGAMIIPADHTRIGIAYRSAVDHELEGTADFDNSAPFQALLTGAGSGAFVDGPGSTDLETPQSLAVSVAHTLVAAPRWQLLGDITYTDWTVFDQLLIEFDNPEQPPVLQVQDWEGVFRVSAGFNFQASDQFIIRAGLAFDESPIPSAERRTARIAGSDRMWFSVGLGYRPSDRFSFDFGLTHITLDDSAINNSFPESGPSASFVRGIVESSATIASASINWKIK